MKRSLLTMMLLIGMSSAWADDQAKPAQASPQSTQASANKPEPVKEQPSLYDNTKSGWNQFIDMLAGPPKN